MLTPRRQQLVQNIQIVLQQSSSFAITQENVIWLMQQIGAYQQEWDFVVHLNSLAQQNSPHPLSISSNFNEHFGSNSWGCRACRCHSYTGIQGSGYFCACGHPWESHAA